MSGRPGIDLPDHRGRTGLDRAGRDLLRNPDVRVREVELTSQGWHVLRRTTFDYRRRDGRWTTQRRETYDRGDGAAVLPYDTARGTVLLTRQFRYPAYVNGHPDGMLIEVAAGLIDASDPTGPDGPAGAVRREGMEELGVELGPLTHVLDAYMSPGSVTERLHCYAAPYRRDGLTGRGGGLEEDGEDIEVLELPFAEALAMTRDGRIADGKTVLLLQWAVLDGPFAGRPAARR
ncbi:NUDIX domain-containing protein [Kitasatospora phosalacinea]|uniref:NUDIX domain-containing protein n=1 Tax=Kitasatospora phosalacinea TaxID=2065 RepID=UPI0005244CCE|nr:NUDIX domain-containing protein [Kitasatospora phosalacinea]